MKAILRKVSSLVLASSLFTSGLMVGTPSLGIGVNADAIFDSVVMDFEKTSLADDGFIVVEDGNDDYKLFNNKGCKVSIVDGKGRNDSKALKIIPNSEQSKIGYDVGTTFSEAVTGKIISSWVYYDGTSSGSHIVMSLDGGKYSDGDSQNLCFGIRTGSYSAYIYADANSPKPVVKNSSLKPTVGWHNLVVDMTKAGTITYKVDDQVFATQQLATGEQGNFKKLSFINFWTAGPNEVLVDDVTITDGLIAPYEPIVKDAENTFGFKLAYGTEISNYEYSLNAGQSWTDCTSNVIEVGDINLAVGQLLVRHKVPAGADEANYPTISNTKPYTKSAGIITEISETKDFEVQGDATQGIDPLKGFSTTKGTFELNDDPKYVHSGASSLKLTYDEKNVGMDVFYSYDEMQVGKKFSVWFYDDLDPARVARIILNGSTKKPTDAYEIYFGLKNTNKNPNVQYLASTKLIDEDGKQSYSKQEFYVPERTEGWNKLTIDMTVKGEISYYIGDDLVGTLELSQDDYAEFKKVTFANYWLEPKDPDKQSVYFDDITISKPAPMPKSIVVDDEDNTLSFTPDDSIPDAFKYEYTLDGGESWTTCTSSKIYVGNKDIPAKNIEVRCIAPDGEIRVYPSAVTTNGFTYTLNMHLDMETSDDLLGFVTGTGQQKVNFENSTDYSRSGLTSMHIIPTKEDKSNPSFIKWPYQESLKYDEIITDKVLTYWYYDKMEGTNTSYYKAATQVVNGKSGTDAQMFRIGVSTNVTKDKYSLTMTKDGAYLPNVISKTPRSEGWHMFQFDFASEAGKCSVYVDDECLGTYESDGFKQIDFIDFWSLGKLTHYYDDMTITDSREDVPVVPQAPTNPVSDDTVNTFGWDFVEGKTDVSLYEYSIDSGKTFQTATANPQAIPEQMLEPGEVMVRLKATSDTMAGAVLRSEGRFSDPASVAKEKLEDLIKFCTFSNPDDYTDETYSVLVKAVEDAKVELAKENGEYQKAIDEINSARDGLVFDLDGTRTYTFEDENSYVPVQPAIGTIDWSDGNTSFVTKKGYKILSSLVDGKNQAQFTYNFPKAISDKQITFINRIYDLNPTTTFKLGNSETGEGFAYVLDAKNFQIKYYDIKNGEMVNERELGLRRQNEMTKIEINLTNDGTQLLYEGNVVFSNPNISEIDYIDIYSVGRNASEVTSTWVDEFTINDKNAVTKIDYPVDEIVLGYYDTYELNYINAKYTTPYDYDTTDRFIYKSADPKIARVNLNGSVQAMSPGKTTVTVSTANGYSKTIPVTVEDFKVESVNLSDSLITQAPNFIDNLVMTPDTMKVVNAILSPEGATNRNKTWTSSDESVATVEDGKITALKVGTADITVKTDDGNKTDTIKVNVVAPRSEYAIEIFVAEDGNDMTGTGSIEKPFATIERARDEVRTLTQIVDGGAVVYVREGTYFVNHSISLEMRDSGNEENPVKYSAYKDEKVTITGAVSLSPSDFTLVNDAETVNKLQNSAKGKVYEADISEFLGDTMLQIKLEGIGSSKTDQTSASYFLNKDGYNSSLPYYAVSFGGDAMTLSRWPNENETPAGSKFAGFAKINSIPYAGQTLRSWNNDQKGRPGYIEAEDRDAYDSPEYILNALTERMKTWNGIPLDGTNILDLDIWYNGYTGVDYAIQTSPIKYIEADGTVKPLVAGHYGGVMKDFLRLYFFNLIQELDIPGEWFIDKNTGKLYMIPPTGSDMNSDEELISISMLTDTMFTLNGTDNLTIDNIDMTDMLGGAISIQNANHSKLSNSTITNTSSRIGSVGGKSTYSGIEYCEIKDVNGGFSVGGGDTRTLVAANNFVHGCHFDNYQTLTNGFNSAVSMSGVGNVASCNEIENSPNNALMWQGNDNVIEFNEIHHVDLQTTDTSAIYTGRNVLNRGTVIKNNYFHHLGKTASKASANSAIYIDDVAGGISIYDNKFEDLHWGVFVNGGQENYIIDNEFKNCTYGVVANDWALLWGERWYQHGYGLLNMSNQELIDIDWWSENSPYAKYHNFQTIMDGDDRNFSIYNKVIGNTLLEGTTLYNFMYRRSQPNAETAILDWYFTKDN